MRGSSLVACARGQRTEVRILVQTVARTSICLLSLLSAARAQPGAAANENDIAQQGEPPVQADSEEPSGREQRLLRQIVFRDRHSQTTIEQAQNALRAREVSRGVELLQQVLDQQGDHFIWLESEGRLASARRRAHSLLGAADPKTREFYDWAHSAEAQRLLERARAAGEPALMSEVSRRFFHTVSGFEATDWLATRWLDRGEYALAARAWKLLAADPCHRERITAVMRRKQQAAEQMCQHNATAPPRVRNAASRTASPEVRQVDYRTPEGQAPNPRTADASAGDETASDQPANSTQPAASTQRAATLAAAELNGGTSPNVSSAIPYMAPTWRVSLVEAKNIAEKPLSDLLHRWESQPQQHDDKRPIAVHTPQVVGDAIVLRDYRGLCALDLKTSRELWRFTPSTSLARALGASAPVRAMESNSSRETPRDTLMAAYASNAILGALTTDGRRVFAVDSMDIRPRQSSPPPDEEGASQRGSQRLSRTANRLVAFDVAHVRRDATGAAQPDWSVGGAVGTSHWFYRMDVNDDGRVTQAEFLGSADQFKKLDRNRDGAIDFAEAESGAALISREPLHGHFFMGPPLALDGRLYAITECDCQLNLVALSAANGAVQWVQGIGYVDRPIDEEMSRYTLACIPSSGSGVIVCPTQMGVIVGVDALDGALLWTYYCGDEDLAGGDVNWSLGSRHPFGNPGFRSDPLVEGNRIIVLPRQSEWIHCVDITTGRGIWKKPRADGEFVAAAANDVVMIVGERQCRGLSITDGSERWSSRLGEIAGTGARVGNEYLVPLADNRIAAVEIRSGVRRGDLSSTRNAESHTQTEADKEEPPPDGVAATSQDDDDKIADAPSEPTPGNLIGAGSLIVSCGPREIVAYPQAEALLEQVQQKLANGPAVSSDLALAADLELTLGRISDAKLYLGRAATTAASTEFAERTARLKRTVLLEELTVGCDQPRLCLKELEGLSQTPAQRCRFLQAKSEVGIRGGDIGAVLAASREFASLGSTHLLLSQTDPAYLISTRAWLAATDQRIRHDFPAAVAENLTAQIVAEQQRVLHGRDRGALEQFIDVYGSRPEADEVRLKLAELAAADGQLQQAELLLLRCEHCPRTVTVRQAREQLVQIWDRAGLGEEAAELIVELERQGSTDKRDTATAQRLLAKLPADGLTRHAYHRLKAGEALGGPARVTQSLWEHCDTDLAEKYANAARPFVTRPGVPFQLIDAGSSLEPRISIVDRLSGTIVGNLQIPSHYWGATLAATSQVGHFLPLGSRASFHGISLLERDGERPFWTTAPSRIAQDQDSSLVGPSGPSFSVFQSHRHLYVVDPASGKVLWHRTDLDPQSGLVSDPIRGIFGDDEALVVLGSDHLTYTVYRTATGEELRQGVLDPTTRHIPERRAFGRCLLHFTTHDGAHRMRIWDPLADRYLYDCVVSDRLLWKETGDDEVAVITAGGALQIVDGHTGTVRIQLPLKPTEIQNLCQVSAFRDADRYYVNLQPLQSMPEPRRYSYCFGTDTILPRADLRGNLIAIERRTGQVLWKRTFAQRTVLRVPTLRLPVLVMLALVGDRLNGNHRSMLVEVIDSKTGDTIAFDDNRMPNRILQMTYEEDAARVRLWGVKSVVDLNFEPRGSRISAENAAR